MNHEQLKELVYDVVSKFYPRTVWVEQVNTQLKAPFVTLKLGDASRQLFGCMNPDASIFRTDSTFLEINLCTNGRKLEVEGAITTNYINTSVTDLNDLVDYLESEEIQDLVSSKGVSMILNGGVNDISELSNETQYSYRAMVAFDVSYYRETDGKYGVLNMPDPTNPSGGGSEELRQELAAIETVEIENIDETKEENANEE